MSDDDVEPQPQTQAGASPAPAQNGNASAPAGGLANAGNGAFGTEVGQSQPPITGRGEAGVGQLTPANASHKAASAAVVRNSGNRDFEEKEAVERQLALRAHQNRVVASFLNKLVSGTIEENASLFGTDTTDEGSSLIEKYYAEA